VQNLPNPRSELEAHYYNPAHTGLLAIGLQPHFLTEERLDEMMRLIVRYKSNIRADRIFNNVRWQKQEPE